ncbi:MAG: ferritin family protein [Anaerolineae bacterium]|jgi:rubrerythrin
MAIFNAAEALDIAMQVEKNGQSFYARAAENAEDAEIKALLEELAEWEVEHYNTFKELAEQIGEAPRLSGPMWEEYDQYLETALDNALFQGPDKALAAADELENEREALKMALGFEKDALLFYYDLWHIMPERQQEAVERIITEEKAHATRLARMLLTGETEL